MRLPAMITAITAEVGRRGRSRTAVCVQHGELPRPAPCGLSEEVTQLERGAVIITAIESARRQPPSHAGIAGVARRIEGPAWKVTGAGTIRCELGHILRIAGARPQPPQLAI
jgi:hypothetical protein